ncbi:MAG: hypothetical protein GY731_17620 [Gammaproteobacteria bacterium]|nr:hypothetical protein [Gammaproteobacteria bacterium]
MENSATPITSNKKNPATKKEKNLRCAKCGHPITRETARITVNSAHEHGFINPSGFSFHIGCFSEAPGCGLVGEATDEHSWFPGYTWRIALCAGCGIHLGWDFHSAGSDRFYGLITGMLTPGEQ